MLKRLTWRKALIGLVGLGVLGFLILQILPVGMIAKSFGHHGNPPVVQAFEWSSPEAEEIARRACYDCHSHETRYPWYSSFAPISWFTNRHIYYGRKGLNFSDYDGQDYATRTNQEHLEGHLLWDMPPNSYLLIHNDAELTQDERQLLLDELVASLEGEMSDEMNMDMGGNN